MLSTLKFSSAVSCCGWGLRSARRWPSGVLLRWILPGYSNIGSTTQQHNKRASSLRWGFAPLAAGLPGCCCGGSCCCRATRTEDLCRANRTEDLCRANRTEDLCRANRTEDLCRANRTEDLCRANRTEDLCRAASASPPSASASPPSASASPPSASVFTSPLPPARC